MNQPTRPVGEVAAQRRDLAVLRTPPHLYTRADPHIVRDGEGIAVDA